jgi:GAF domain-containing protein
LIVADKLIGSVGLDLFTTTRSFNPDTLDLVEAVTNQLAIFLQDVRTRRERERSIEQVRLLDQIGSRFLTLNRVDALLEEAARGLQGYLKSNRVVIRLGNPTESEEAGS